METGERHNRQTSGYYRDEFGRIARFYDMGLRLAFKLIGGEDAFRQAIVEVAEIHPGNSALDVSCGTGTLALLMAERAGPGGKVTATDLAEKMLAIARGKDRAGKVDFVHANSEDLPFDDASFDRVTSSLAIHEMNRQGRANALAEMYRVLCSGGRLAVADLRKPDSLMTRIGMGVVTLGETHTLPDLWEHGLDREIEEAGFVINGRRVAGKGFFEIIGAEKQPGA